MSPGGTPWFYIGMRDVYTPMHFDYHDHIVAQVGVSLCLSVTL